MCSITGATFVGENVFCKKTNVFQQTDSLLEKNMLPPTETAPLTIAFHSWRKQWTNEQFPDPKLMFGRFSYLFVCRVLLFGPLWPMYVCWHLCFPIECSVWTPIGIHPQTSQVRDDTLDVILWYVCIHIVVHVVSVIECSNTRKVKTIRWQTQCCAMCLASPDICPKILFAPVVAELSRILGICFFFGLGSVTYSVDRQSSHVYNATSKFPRLFIVFSWKDKFDSMELSCLEHKRCVYMRVVAYK